LRDTGVQFASLAKRLAWLYGRTSGAVRWGLGRMERLLAALGHPERRFEVVHVAGTNGKGSVAALCAQALTGSVRVGLYTSPHLVRFGERIRVDGAPVADDVLASLLDRLLPLVEATDATFFEATTALAFLAFAEIGVDVAVVEVGLGGRLDATNVVTPRVAVVTAIDYDHQDVLGHTLEEIASEKAGIFKRNVPAVVGEPRRSLRPVFEDAARRVNAPLVFVDDVAAVECVDMALTGTRGRLRTSGWGSLEVDLPLVGEHQARNALVAAEALAQLPAAWRPTAAALLERWRRVRWPGRFEVVPRVPSGWWIFDVAHNSASIDALVATLQRVAPPRPWVAVLGVLADKDWRAIVRRLAPAVDELICVLPPSAPPARRWDPHEAATFAAALGVCARAAPFEAALADAERAGATAIVTGSFTTVGDARIRLGWDP